MKFTKPLALVCILIGTLMAFGQDKPAATTAAATQAAAPSRPAMIAGGEWKVAGEVVEQTSGESPALLMFGDKSWADYTIELEAQKTGGDEGFLIAVRAQSPRDLVWFNVGGWGNTRTAFEFANGDAGKTDFGDQQTYGDFQEVVTDKWHKLKVVVAGNNVDGYVDGKPACAFNAPSLKTGGVAIGTWSTQAKFRNVKVTSKDGKVLWQGAPNLLFSTSGGEWTLSADALQQGNADSPALLSFGEKTWKNYTVELEAQKTDGDEGFLVAVRMKDPQNLVWFNVGG